MPSKCDHIFVPDQYGEVSCIKCYVPDDEMDVVIAELVAVDFWATQTSFEE